MERLCETLQSVTAIAPVSQAAAGSATSKYLDAAEATEILFLVSCGALAEGKKVTVEVYNADNADGTGAEKIGTGEITGAVTEAVYPVSVQVRGNLGQYYAIKASNDAEAAVLISASALLRQTYYPDSGNCLMV